MKKLMNFFRRELHHANRFFFHFSDEKSKILSGHFLDFYVFYVIKYWIFRPLFGVFNALFAIIVISFVTIFAISPLFLLVCFLFLSATADFFFVLLFHVFITLPYIYAIRPFFIFVYYFFTDMVLELHSWFLFFYKFTLSAYLDIWYAKNKSKIGDYCDRVTYFFYLVYYRFVKYLRKFFRGIYIFIFVFPKEFRWALVRKPYLKFMNMYVPAGFRANWLVVGEYYEDVAYAEVFDDIVNSLKRFFLKVLKLEYVFIFLKNFFSYIYGFYELLIIRYVVYPFFRLVEVYLRNCNDLSEHLFSRYGYYFSVLPRLPLRLFLVAPFLLFLLGSAQFIEHGLYVRSVHYPFLWWDTSGWLHPVTVAGIISLLLLVSMYIAFSWSSNFRKDFDFFGFGVLVVIVFSQYWIIHMDHDISAWPEWQILLKQLGFFDAIFVVRDCISAYGLFALLIFFFLLVTFVTVIRSCRNLYSFRLTNREYFDIFLSNDPLEKYFFFDEGDWESIAIDDRCYTIDPFKSYLNELYAKKTISGSWILVPLTSRGRYLLRMRNRTIKFLDLTQKFKNS